MEVILQENYPSLGYVGDRVTVKRGFARNYLLPRGIAIEVSSQSAKELRHKVEIIEAKKKRLKLDAEQEAEKLAIARLEFTLKVGKGGKAFGSITSRDIETALKAQGFEITRKQIRLAEPIKTVGETKIEVKLHSDVSVPVIVNVEGELMKEVLKEMEKGKKKKAKSKDASLEDGELDADSEDFEDADDLDMDSEAEFSGDEEGSEQSDADSEGDAEEEDDQQQDS